MRGTIYIPPSCRTAERHLALAFRKGLSVLTKQEFVRVWCSLFFLYPGLHPDGFASRGSGWPKRFKPLAAEAWQRLESAKLSEKELYCYQACRSRIKMELAKVIRTKPSLLKLHSAA